MSCTGLCALPLLAHATGETTAKPSQGVPTRSAGMLCASTHEAKGVWAVTICDPDGVCVLLFHVDTSTIE